MNDFDIFLSELENYNEKCNDCSSEKRIELFEKMGFGMFVHFGLYSQLGQGEWIFDIDDKLVGYAWQNVAQGLWNDHLPQRLGVCHTDGVGPFELALVDGYDATANNFRHVGACVDGNDD